MEQKMFLYLSNGFAENPEISSMLVKVSALLDAKPAFKNDRRIFVFKGCLPEKPRHPRLTFAAISKKEGAAHDGEQFLGFHDLLAKLTSVRGPVRSCL
jgi:hypothetical protein